MTEGFVGRAHELQDIERACDAAVTQGRGSLIVVSGEAGIGKTRLCEEAAERARRAGLHVVSARCWADSGAPALWPWQPIVAELCGAEAADLLASDSGSAGIDPDRFVRFAAVADRLAEACARSPACLIVDDVHAADAATLLLARFVAGSLPRLPLVLLLARRTGEPADGGTDTTARMLDEIETAATPVVLGRLDLDETAALLAAHGLGDLAPDLVAALHGVTGGNPLFLRRIAGMGPLRPGEALPSGLPMAIEQALSRLSPETQAVLRASAVLGLAPSVTEAAAVANRDPVGVLDAVAEAEGLVGAEEPGWFAFSHELVRSALEAGLTPAERLDAHARAAAVLASDGPAVPPEDLARRAHHALAAAPRSVEDARLAVLACWAAATSMVGHFAYEQADALLSSAVAQYGPSALGEPPAALLVDWARAALRCGRLIEARQRFDRAASAAEREEAPELLAEAALGLGGNWVNEYRTPVERARVLGLQRTALAGLPTWSTALRCRLEARLAAEAVFDGEPVERVLAAVDAARECGDPVALAEALSLCHHVLLRPDWTDRRLTLADELVRVASEAGHGVLGLMGLCWRAVDLFLLGDDRALPALEDLRERATALACRSILYIAEVIDVMLLIRAGRLDEAEAAAARGFEVGEAIGEIDTLGYYAAHTLAIRWAQGRDSELLDMADEVAASPTLMKDDFAFRAVAAAFAARAGKRERARAALDQLTAGGLAALPQPSTWLVGMVAVADTAATLGDSAIARETYDLLLPFAELPTIGGLAVICLGSTERALGVAASAFGDHDLAVEHLERAVAANQRLGNFPLVAVARGDLARSLHRRGRRRDRVRAADELRRAIADAEGMRMPERAAAWRDELAAVEARDAERPTVRAIDDRDAHVRRGTIARDEDRWIVAVDGQRVRVADMVGMRYVAELLTRPGQSIPALTLASQDSVPDDASPHEVLDDEARARYAARARELTSDLAEAEADNDIVRAERVRDELDALIDQLEAATGLAGRPRRFSDPAERARTAVSKAIKRAIDAVDDANPVVAEALRSSITTGTRCSYTPDPRHPIAWSTSSESPEAPAPTATAS
jgi:tetratricopeptide (TPR) repeat protein